MGISPKDWPTIAAVFEMTVEQFVALANEHNGPPQDDALRQVAERWDRPSPAIRDAILALAKSGDQP